MEAKRGLVRLEVGAASALALSFFEQQSSDFSGEGSTARGEGTAASREGTESKQGDTVFSADTPSSFPLSPDSGDGEGDLPARENPQILPPRQRHRNGNEVTASRTHGQERQAQPCPTEHWMMRPCRRSLIYKTVVRRS